MTFEFAPLGVARSSATFSPDQNYRYALQRSWDLARPRVCFVMLNPSTADALSDDPTIRRCVGFAKSWGYGSLDVVNLFAWRSTEPSALPHVKDPVGPDNDAAIVAACRRSERIVGAWGVNVATWPELRPRPEIVQRLIHATDRDVHAIRITKGLHPEHPLFLPGKLRPVMFAARSIRISPP